LVACGDLNRFAPFALKIFLTAGNAKFFAKDAKGFFAFEIKNNSRKLVKLLKPAAICRGEI
jgi:hypothetical protein